ncbi:MAG: adenylosuccinate synthetase, partial [Nitrososphaera sp.]|nr:adenylosuccinate synthetase [Nitrososphaera sp.]
VLLDEWHGFHPYTTWSTTVPANALEIVRESGFSGEIETVGVQRAYATRHGAGPFVTEDKDGELNGISPHEHNMQDAWQGEFRFGCLDGVMLRYATECVRAYGKLDSIALTHLDAFDRHTNLLVCDEYNVPAGVSANLADVEAGDRNIVRRLIPNFARDLEHQEGLTDLLGRSTALFGGTFSTADGIADYIKAITCAPVRYRSFGPTAKDKNA